MKKNIIVTAIFFVLMAVAALLFTLLSEKKDSTAWIFLITTELSLLLFGGAAALHYSQKHFTKKIKNAALSFAVFYAVAAVVINVLFSRFFPTKTNIYLTIHIFLAILLCVIFMTSILSKKKKRYNRNKSKEALTTGIPSLLLEIQRLEASVSKLNQEIQIDIESMLLSLDKEVRYVTIPEGEEGESFQIYLKEKISELIPIMNNLIETQGEDTQPFSKMIIDLKYLLDNPEIAPRRTIPSLETSIENEQSMPVPSSDERISSDEKEVDVEIPISIPLRSIDLESLKTPDYKEITDFSDLEKIPEAPKTFKTRKKNKTAEPAADQKIAESVNTTEIEESSTIIDSKQESTEKKKEKRGFFSRRKSKHPSEEELQSQIDEFFGRTSVDQEDPPQDSESEKPENDVFLSEKQEVQSAFTGKTPLNAADKNITSAADTSDEESIADTFKAKISEIENLAKNISSFEDLERSPDEENKEKNEEEK